MKHETSIGDFCGKDGKYCEEPTCKNCRENLDDCVRWIQNDKLRQWVKDRLETVPEYFWEVPASSSGKYHPEFALGRGGLVRHTKAAVWFARQLFNIMGFTSLEEDIILSSLILHDTWKQGDNEGHTIEGHAERAAQEHCGDAAEDSIRWMVGQAIASHMGKWGSTKPRNNLEWFVHMCDYLASRKDIKINL